MKMRLSALILGGLLGGPAVLACTACFGQSDSQMAQGMNMGIFALLMVITSVLFGIASFFVYLARRSSHLPDATAEQPFSHNASNG
jgi:hypothetical protein